MQQLHPHAAQQLEVHTKADLHTRLRPGMPSLLTPNASQHPDTDEIVHLLQHLGPWCDAGRSYPEAMGGLRALGGALRRRYTRKGAQLLLRIQHHIHASVDRQIVYESPLRCAKSLAAALGNVVSLETQINELQGQLCQQQSQEAVLTASNAALESVIEAAGLLDAYLESRGGPTLFYMWEVPVQEQSSDDASPSFQRVLPMHIEQGGAHGAQPSPPPTPVMPTFVLDARGQVRELADLSGEADVEPYGGNSLGNSQ